MSLIKASITASIRPTAMILHEQPSEPWNDHDFLLIEAYEIFQSERCSCGLLIYMCHSEDDAIQFDVHEDVCAAKVAVETKESKYKDGDRPKGTRLVPFPFMTNGEEFITLREPYYAAEAKRQQEMRQLPPEE